jgi:uncharacterized membrane protein YhaH (DUF805 family)
MGFVEAIRSCLKQYATFFGRASRSEYWFWYLFWLIIQTVSRIVDSCIFPHQEYIHGYSHNYGPTEMVLILIFFMPALAVSARRLHDIGKSGWWLLISLTLVGIIPLVYWFCKAGDSGDNRFGKPPLIPTTLSKSK